MRVAVWWVSVAVRSTERVLAFLLLTLPASALLTVMAEPEIVT